MIAAVTMPKLGVEMESARLQEWSVTEGQAVTAEQVIATIETEKVVFEIEAPATGRIHIAAVVDQEYAIGDLLGSIAPSDEEYRQLLGERPTADLSLAEQSVIAESRSTLSAPPGRRLATPVARRIAREHDLELADISGSGRGGVIRRRDVERAIDTAPGTKTERPLTPHLTPTPASAKVIRLSPLRRTISARMQASIHDSAQMTDIRELDVTALVALRQRVIARVDRLGFKLSLTTLFARAAIIALGQVPELNSTFESETELRRFESVNLGIAVAIEDGLIVPVIHDAERLSIRALDEQMSAVVQRARKRKATAVDLTNGTFTITNFGSFGSHMGTPILMPPQVGILGIGTVLERPVVRDGEIVVGAVMYACLTVDHRVIDGETGGRFLTVVEQLVADPDLLLLG